MQRALVCVIFCLLVPVLLFAQVTSYADRVKAMQDNELVRAANDYIDKNNDSILREWIAITEINAPSKHEQERAKYIEGLLRIGRIVGLARR